MRLNFAFTTREMHFVLAHRTFSGIKWNRRFFAIAANICRKRSLRALLCLSISLCADSWRPEEQKSNLLCRRKTLQVGKPLEFKALCLH
jgi:hypothetical protein